MNLCKVVFKVHHGRNEMNFAGKIKLIREHKRLTRVPKMREIMLPPFSFEEGCTWQQKLDVRTNDKGLKSAKEKTQEV